eukprot:TRINITY_DN7879_c0_g1_i1.p1 TRINITY_DN7879_c0_g1~~TRINITY_DN7879_c0_g1_i1.p1  ORF type:complete len:927 (+),score=233.70 TRINITY_DN7879_c0_g1_i1:139-2781(+)
MKANLRSVGIEKIYQIPFMKTQIDNEWMSNRDFFLRKNYIRENANRKGITNNELVRSLTHYSAWKKISKLEKKRVLVIEDSVLLNTKQFKRRLSEFSRTDNVVFLSNQVIEDGIEYLQHGIKAYFISSAIADTLANSFKENLMVFEDFMLWKSNMRSDVSWAEKEAAVFKVSWEDNFLLTKNEKAIEFSAEMSDIIHNTQLEIYTAKSKLYFYHIIISDKMTDDLLRLTRSDDYYGIPYNIFGFNEPPGNGKIVSLLRENLPDIRKKLGNKFERTIFRVSTKDSAALFTNAEKIIEKFLRYGTDILFSARKPLAGELRSSLLTSSPFKILRTDLFLATGKGLEKLLAEEDVPAEEEENENLEDTQSENFFISAFKKHFETSPAQLRVDIDFNCDIFLSLYQSSDELELLKNVVFNRRRNTYPSILISEPGFQPDLRFFSDRSEVMRIEPDFSRYSVAKTLVSEDHYPHVFLCFFLHKGTFVQDFLRSISNLDYPKEYISLYFAYTASKISASIMYGEVTEWISEFSAEYLNFEHQEMDDTIKAKDFFMQKALALNADHYFYIDASDILTNNQTVQILINSGKEIVAPMILNYYSDDPKDRNFEYQSFASVAFFHVGSWSIYSAQTYMLSSNKLRQVHGYHHKNTFGNENELFFYVNLIKEGHDFWLQATHNFGSRVLFDGSLQTLTPIYQFYSPNYQFWEHVYLNKPPVINQICGDVSQIDLFNDRFTEDLLGNAVTLLQNKWQKSKNRKEWLRLSEIFFQDTWDRIVERVILPIYKPSLKYKKSILSLIERYSGFTKSTSSLKTIKGSSTITINVGLVVTPNEENVHDWTFFGKCGYTHLKPGSLLIYPSSYIQKSNVLPADDHNKKYNLISIIEVEEM